MKKIYAGEICLNDVNVGDILYECEYGDTIKVEVLTKPERSIYTDGDYCWTWKAKVVETSRIIRYLVKEKYKQYGPKLYYQPIDWKNRTTGRLFNPNCMDFKNDQRIKSIEITEECTRIDFVHRASMIYKNGGWFQMYPGAFIRPVNSEDKYGLFKAFGIPIAPAKHFFERQGEYRTYTLIFRALPLNTTQIDIIEKEAPGDYFNFYGVDFSNWTTIPHAADLPISEN